MGALLEKTENQLKPAKTSSFFSHYEIKYKCFTNQGRDPLAEV